LFFKNFGDLASEISQIWLHTKYENREKPESFYYRVFFFGKIWQPGDREKGWRIQQSVFFWKNNKKIAISWRKKKSLEVATFRQCVTVGRQN
jgi:hypothetical protein